MMHVLLGVQSFEVGFYVRPNFVDVGFVLPLPHLDLGEIRKNTFVRCIVASSLHRLWVRRISATDFVVCLVALRRL